MFVLMAGNDLGDFREYDPNLLDDPQWPCGKHKRVLIFPSYMVRKYSSRMLHLITTTSTTATAASGEQNGKVVFVHDMICWNRYPLCCYVFCWDVLQYLSVDAFCQWLFLSLWTLFVLSFPTTAKNNNTPERFVCPNSLLKKKILRNFIVCFWKGVRRMFQTVVISKVTGRDCLPPLSD